jgi:hypothetical protein
MTFFGLTVAGVGSIIISLIGFIIGMRVAKDRADRAVLRELYQDIYAQFRDIHDQSMSGKPKRWSDYPLVASRYVPKVMALEKDGRIGMLPDRLGKALLQLEQDALVAASNFYSAVTDETLRAQIASTFDLRVDSPRRMLNGRAYVSYNLAELASKGTSNFRSRDDLTLGYGFMIPCLEKPGDQFYIYPEQMRVGNVDELFEQIAADIKGNERLQSAITVLATIQVRTRSVLMVLASRIKDPNPFWETLTQALPDLFRR